MKGFNSLISAFILLLCLGRSEVVFSQWTSLNPGTSQHIFDIAFPSPDTGYFLPADGIIRRTYDAGLNWMAVGTNHPVHDFGFISNEEGFGCTANVIFHTVDGGLNWDTVYHEPGAGLFKLTVEDWGLIYVVGDNGYDSSVVVRSYDSGVTWNRSVFLESIMVSLVGSDFADAQTGYANDFSSIFKTIDSGNTWINLGADPGQAYNTVYFLSPDTGFALATQLLRTTDGGSTWTQVNTNGNDDNFLDMLFINDTTGYLVGGNGINSGPILKTIDRGLNWNLDTSYVHTFQAICNSGTALFTCGIYGTLWKTDITTGVEEDIISNETIQLLHDFNQQQFIVKGTQVGGKVTVSNMEGKTVVRRNSRESRTCIPFEILSRGNFMIEYSNKMTRISFHGIRP